MEEMRLQQDWAWSGGGGPNEPTQKQNAAKYFVAIRL